MNPEQAVSQLPNYQRIEIWVAAGVVLYLLLVVETIRRHRLKERYSLLWFATGIVVAILTYKREWLETISYILGIHHTPSALLLVLIGFMMVILFHYSTVISRLLDDRTALAQRVGILDGRYRDLQQQLAQLRAEQPPVPEPPPR